MNIGELTASLGVNTTGLYKAEKEFKSFERKANTSLTRTNAMLKSTGKSMQTFGKMASLYLTAPLSLVGGAAFKMHMDFEKSMSKIVGLVGVSKKQVNAWKEDILGMSTAVGKSPKELADAMFFITSAGIKGADALDVLQISAKASAAGLGETKVVADLVTSAMNAYGSATLNATKAADILTATVKEGKAEPAELAASLGMVLPIASNMGVSFDQVGAAVAAMTRTGTNASTASMQLRQILASLLKPTDMAKRGLLQMGTSANELRKMLKEKGLIATLIKLKTITGKYGEEAMSKVFPNIRALSGVLDLVGANAKDNIKIFNSLSNSLGSSSKAFKNASEEDAFKYEQTLAAVKTALTLLGKSLSTMFVPILKMVTKKVQVIVSWLNNLTSSQQKLLTKVVLFAAAIGPVSKILGMLVGNVLPALLTGGTKLIPIIKTVTLAMAANPILAFATALAAVGVAVYAMNSRLSETERIQKGLTDINNEANQSIISQKVNIEQLYRIAKNDNIRLEERQKAIKELNKLSPEYLGNLTLETINTKKAIEVKNNYVNALLKEAKIKGTQQAIIDLQKQYYKDVVQGGAKRLTFMQKFEKGARFVFGSYVNAVSGAYDKVNWAEEYGAAQSKRNLDIANSYYKEAIKERQKELDALNSSYSWDVGELIKPSNVSPLLPGKQTQKFSMVAEYTGKGKAEDVIDPQLEEIMKSVNTQLEKVHTLSQLNLKDYDILAEKNSIYLSAIKKLAEEGYGPATELMQKYRKSIKEVAQTRKEATKSTLSGEDELTAYNRIQEEVNTKLQIQKDLFTTLGGNYNSTTRKIQIYKSALEELVRTQGANAVGVEELKSILKDLGIEYDNITNKSTVLIDKTTMMGSIFSNTFQGMSNSISDALNSTNNVLKAFWKFFSNFIKGMIFKLVAATVAALTLAVVLSALGIGGGAVFSNLDKAAKFADVFKAGFKSFSGMGMANGGQVPPGYPNDTYPAMLTSKERVLNPIQFDTLLNKGGNDINVNIEGVARGEDLYYIVKEIERKHKNRG